MPGFECECGVHGLEHAIHMSHLDPDETDEPTAEELEYVYRSLGVPNPNK